MDKVYDLTIGQASEQLGVSESTIRRLIKKGQLTKEYEKAKRGKKLRLSSAEIEQLISNRDRVLKRENLINYEVYEELRREHEELKARYDAVVYRLGAVETRYKELEAEAESLRERAKKGFWDKIKEWWRGGNR